MRMPDEVPALDERTADLVGVQAPAPGRPAAIPRVGFITDLLRTTRPRQWVKNGFVLVPAVFGGAFHAPQLIRVALATLAFCIAASGLYIVNDVADRDADRLHARKRNRPIAAGRLTPAIAVCCAAVLLTGGAVLAAMAGPAVLGFLGAYVVVTLAYSAWLKHAVIIDVIALASGFVIRVAAGAAAAAVAPSEWLLLCTMFLALFLGFGKRYHELVMLGEVAGGHRRVLDQYTPAALAQFLNASMLATLFSYCLYTFFSPAGQNHRGLMLTIPFAVYGIFRYMLLMETRSEGGAPEEVLIQDRPLQITALVWMAVAAFVIYGPKISV